MYEENLEGFVISPQQRRLWLLQQDGPAYGSGCAVVLEGRVEVEVLRDALRSIAARHEILRTGFYRSPAIRFPLQVIGDGGLPEWQALDLRHLGRAQQDERIEALLREQMRLPFDLESARPLRATLATLSAERHALLLTLPALYADSRTLANLFVELGAAYEACLGGGYDPGEVLQYTQFSEWQNSLLEETDEAAAEHWRLQDLPAQASLPFEQEPAEAQKYRPETFSLDLGARALRQVREAADDRHAEPSAFLFACWAALLRRLTGRPEFVVGLVLDGRTYEPLLEAFGLFAKAVPVRARFGDDSGFAEILARLDGLSREAAEFQAYFTWGQTAEQADEDAVTFPSVGFEFEEAPAGYTAAGVAFSLRTSHAETERFKVKLRCVAACDGLRAEFQYDPAFYPAEVVERAARSFGRLVASAAADPALPIEGLEVLSEEDRRQLLLEWNDTREDYAAGRQSLHALFEEQAAAKPDAAALVYEDERLTYRELNERANRLARRLQSHGVAPESLVGVLMERSTEMVVALLAVLKAGGAYVPLNPEYPKQRLSYIVRDARLSLILSQTWLTEKLPARAAHVITLDQPDEPEPPAAADGSDDLGVTVVPESPAYVIYTSGSTGRPKGVSVPHRAIVNHMLWMGERFPLTPSDAVLQKTPFSFDASVWEFYAPLLCGARLVVARPEGHRDPAYLARVISEQGVSVVQMVPSLLSALLDEPGLARCAGLRRVF
ncbi:MAG: AMP-binding protein, partial [Pyrinomonadaceae bacterium]